MIENKKLKPASALTPGDVTLYGLVRNVKEIGRSVLVWTDKHAAAVTLSRDALVPVTVDYWGDYHANCTRHDTQ